MGFSIQDYLKKINSRLTFPDILSLCITFLGLLLFLGYLYHIQSTTRSEVVYKENSSLIMEENELEETKGKPFGSSKGKTYTFSWCQGSSRISAKNKIYFGSEDEAKLSGRTLSKLCKK